MKIKIIIGLLVIFIVIGGNIFINIFVILIV